jgi:hypothetical protein
MSQPAVNALGALNDTSDDVKGCSMDGREMDGKVGGREDARVLGD